MLHIVESSKPLERVVADLAEAVAANKFGVLGVHDLKQTMAKKGVAFERECRIFEVCNPHQAKTVLEANLEISTALPCRISVYEEGGMTKLATIQAHRHDRALCHAGAAGGRQGGGGDPGGHHGRGRALNVTDVPGETALRRLPRSGAHRVTI